MLFNKGPFKAFSRALVDGIFNISHGGQYTPPTPPTNFFYLIDNEGDYLIDNSGASLIVTSSPTYNVIDNAGNQMIDNAANYLITKT